MQFEDEKIIALRNEAVKKQYNSIETGIYAGDELITFKEFRLFDDRMSIMLPESFTDMDPELAKKKYPSENRPQIIITSSDTTVNFTFSLFNETIHPTQMETALNDYCLAIKNVYPANLFIDNGVIKSTSNLSYWASFKSSSLNGMIYNFILITSINNFFLLGMFNCPFQNWMAWKPIVISIYETIDNLLKKES